MSELEKSGNNDNFQTAVEDLIKIFPSKEDFMRMFQVYEELNKRFDAGATVIKVYGCSMFCVEEEPTTKKEYMNYSRERKIATIKGITFEYNEIIARCPDCGAEIIPLELSQFNINSMFNEYYKITGQNKNEEAVNSKHVVRERKNK